MTIIFEDVEYKDGKKVVLKNINLELLPNKIYGLLGKNGAGKTTFLSLLTGFIKQTNGTILVNNKSIFNHQPTVSSIQYVYNRKMDSGSKVEKAFKNLSKIKPHLDLCYAYSLLEKFEIPKNIKLKKLSLGKQAAVHAIIGLANRTPITIYDEIYLGMDAQTRDLFYGEVLNDYTENPRTIIFSTHLISEMENLFEDIIVMNEGRIILHESVEDVKDSAYAISGEINELTSLQMNWNVIGEEIFGREKRVFVYQEKIPLMNGLKIEPITLQQLIILLTNGGKKNEEK